MGYIKYDTVELKPEILNGKYIIYFYKERKEYSNETIGVVYLIQNNNSYNTYDEYKESNKYTGRNLEKDNFHEDETYLFSFSGDTKQEVLQYVKRALINYKKYNVQHNLDVMEKFVDKNMDRITIEKDNSFKIKDKYNAPPIVSEKRASPQQLAKQFKIPVHKVWAKMRRNYRGY